MLKRRCISLVVLDHEFEEARAIAVFDFEYDAAAGEHDELYDAVGVVGGDLFEYVRGDVIVEFVLHLIVNAIVRDLRSAVFEFLLTSAARNEAFECDLFEFGLRVFNGHFSHDL